MIFIIIALFLALLRQICCCVQHEMDEESFVGETLEVLVDSNNTSPRGMALLRALSDRRRSRFRSSPPPPPTTSEPLLTFSSALIKLLVAGRHPGFLDLDLDFSVLGSQLRAAAPLPPHESHLALVLWRPPPSFGPAPISEGQADFAISQAFLDVVVEHLWALNKSVPAVEKATPSASAARGDTSPTAIPSVDPIDLKAPLTVDALDVKEPMKTSPATTTAARVAKSTGGVKLNTFAAKSRWEGAPDVQVVRAIGKGGFATVYAVEDQDGRVWALKVTRRNKYTLNIHQREVVGLSGCNPNLVRLEGHAAGPEYLFLQMQLATGGDLLDFYKSRDMSASERLGVVSEVASALAYLHARKIVHHDVKLENILIRERRGYRSAVLSDLGLCTAAPTVTDWGTPGWRAPQVVRNESHGTGADIWSLGIVLFALWSGNDLGDMLTAGGVTKKEFRILLDGACVEGPLPCWFEADVFQSSQFGLDVADLVSFMSDVNEETRPSASRVRTLLYELMIDYEDEPGFSASWGYLRGPELLERS